MTHYRVTNYSLKITIVYNILDESNLIKWVSFLVFLFN